MRHYWIMAGCFLAIACLAGAANAAVPQLISFQGRLTDVGGSPIDTTADLTFTIYSDSGGTTSIWIETHSDVLIEQGVFSVFLGQSTAFGPAVFSGQTRYLGFQLAGGSMSDPLLPIVSGAYSLRSAHCDTADYALNSPGGGSGSGWTDDGTIVHLTNTNDSVGIGTDNPMAPLHVDGSMRAIHGISHGSNPAAGLFGSNDSNGFGVLGVSTSGSGVYGASTTGFGGYFHGTRNYISPDLGIGTETPEEMLHLENDASGGRAYLKVETSHPSNWHEAGIRFQTPQNTWHFRMDDNANNNMPSGGLGLRSQNLNAEVMTWGENGRIGIGTTSPNYPLEIVSSDTPLRSRCSGSGIGVYASSSSGFGMYSDATKNFMGGLTGFGQTNPTHRITVNGAIGIQESGTTRFHLNYVNGGLNFVETGVADYRLNIETGGNVGIGIGNPAEKLHVAGNVRLDGTLMADDFEDNSINRYDIIDEVGIASATVVNLSFLTTSWTSYVSKVIIVPSPGYILALGSAYCELDHQADGHSQANLVISDQPDASNGGTSARIYLAENVAPGDYGCSIRCRRLLFVDAPGAYTYYLLGRRDVADTDYDATISSKQLDLLFIPTAYGSKHLADGGDAEYSTMATSRMRNDQPASDMASDLSGNEIDRLRAELTVLQQTVAGLQSRLDANER